MSTLTLRPGDVVSFLGDSITAGVGQGSYYAANYIPTINAAYQKAGTVMTTTLAQATTRAGAVSTSPLLAPQDYRPTVLNAGVSGDTIAMMLARVNTDVIAHNPTVVIIEGVINDVKNGTNLGTLAATCATLISTIKAALPGVRMLWVGGFCFGETYPSAGADIPTPSYNAVVATACANAGIPYVDVRTPQQAYEAIHNPPPTSVDTGIMCLDAGPPGVHPSAAVGQPVFGTAMLAQTVLTGTP